MIATLLIFLLTISILVTVHEYGHFQMAKWCGVKVLKFSIGFGKPLWTKRFGQDKTELVIASIPLGGYVKMFDEREFDATLKDNAANTYPEAILKRAFNRQPVLKRMAIVLAGPVANLLLAIALYWLLFGMGVTGMKPILGKVTAHSPVALANFAEGEEIQKINGKAAHSWQEVSWLLLNESLKNKQLTVETLNPHHKPHIHQLDLSHVKLDDATKDILGILGFTAFKPNIPALIGEVSPNSPADLAGFKSNDVILNINQQPVAVWEDFLQVVRANPNKPLEVRVQRNLAQIKLVITPQATNENGKKIGRVGMAFKLSPEIEAQIFVTTHYSTWQALTKALEKTWDTVIFTLKMLGKMLVGEASLSGISGPVTIASYAGQSAHMGLKVFLGFLAVISISIGVLNLLPIPVLDGGHLMYDIVEIFTGKPVSDTVLNVGQKIGFSLLGCMMILAFYNDINRLITG